MKIDITGASNFVNRMFEACGNYQWARELLKNSLEAGATKVEFGIEWQAVKKLGVYRRTVADNGHGMSRDELVRFFRTLGEGGKKIGGVHDNFGVGAKIAALPWNPEGVIAISYKDGKGSMIWIALDRDSGDYELLEFETKEGKTVAVDPAKVKTEDGIAWGSVRPSWIKEHGTIMILLGNEQNSDTVLGNPSAGEKELKGLSVYLNTRFWEFTNVDIRVVELRNEKKDKWPKGQDDKDDSRRPNNRQIRGARFFLSDVKAQKDGCLRDKGSLTLDDGRVKLEWYLWEGARPSVHSHAKENGYIATRYNDELFHITSNKPDFRQFGIIESKVQQNLTIILEPQHYHSDTSPWGVHPDQSRNRLIFTNGDEKGVDVPLSDWGHEFLKKMPASILEAIQKARGEMSGTIDDEEYRKRLQDKFGSRWTTMGLVKAGEIEKTSTQGTSTDDGLRGRGKQGGGGKKHSKTKRVIQTVDGPTKAVQGEVPVDVPKYRYAHEDDFEKPWHMAVWAPNDPAGPSVLINTDSPILKDVVEYHTKQFPDVHAEEVMKTVLGVFGEVAVSKIAHSQKLSKLVPEQELDHDYRNEQALTIALMGLLAEESVIAQRLKRFGPRQAS